MSNQPLSPPPVPPAPPMPVMPGQAGPNSGLATASLVLGILGFCTMGVSALVGLILGIGGLTRIKASGGRLRGEGLAIAGIVVSAVCLFMLPLMIGILVPALGTAKANANLMKSQLQAKAIANQAAMWADVHGGTWPSDIGVLLVADRGLEPLAPKMLVCPGARAPIPDSPAMSAEWLRMWGNANSSYIYLPPGGRGIGAAPVVILVQKPELAIGRRVTVAYGDCHAEAMKVAAAMAMLGQQPAGPPAGLQP